MKKILSTGTVILGLVFSGPLDEELETVEKLFNLIEEKIKEVGQIAEKNIGRGKIEK